MFIIKIGETTLLTIITIFLQEYIQLGLIVLFKLLTFLEHYVQDETNKYIKIKLF